MSVWSRAEGRVPMLHLGLGCKPSAVVAGLTRCCMCQLSLCGECAVEGCRTRQSPRRFSRPLSEIWSTAGRTRTQVQPIRGPACDGHAVQSALPVSAAECHLLPASCESALRLQRLPVQMSSAKTRSRQRLSSRQSPERSASTSTSLGCLLAFCCMPMLFLTSLAYLT